MTIFHGHKRGLRLAAAAAIGTTVAGVLVAVVLPASAQSAPTKADAYAAASAKVTHPDQDTLGSQVRKHEGTGHVVIRPQVAGTPGLDVSSYQGNVDWATVAADGAKWMYTKATESTTYTNPYFSQQYTGAYNAGLVHGAYHFATPNTSSGAAQADYFVAHGGGWSKDGKTFPGMLDMEWNPYGADCYGLSQAGMAGWINDFSNEYHAKTTRWPVIYTATSWWNECVGTAGGFAANNPLMLACYCSSPGTMPYNWGYQTIWQYADSGTFPGDQDSFNGDYSRVQAMANG